MAYADYNYFNDLYFDMWITEAEFNRLSWEASNFLDKATTGVDNVHKLREYFPTDAEAAESVKHCFCAIVKLMLDISRAECDARMAGGFITAPDGTIMPRMASSISSGSESRTFSANIAAANPYFAVVGNADAQNAMYRAQVKKYLSGVSDANGVNLLYMGEYPNV